MNFRGWRDLGALNDPLMLFGGPYSNAQATNALIAEAARLGVAPDHAICTGDVVAYCGDPVGAVRAIRDWGCVVVAGNCEAQLAAGADDCGCGFAPGTACDALSDEWFAYASAHIDEDARAWMGAAPRGVVFTRRGRRFAVIHGGAGDASRFIWSSDPVEAKLAEIQALEAALGPLDGVICGHSGIAFAEEVEGRLWLNAGVIGMPGNTGRRTTEFVTMRDDDVELHRLTYDAEAAAAAMAGRNTPYAEALLTGWWPSEEVLPQELRRQRPAA